MRYRTSFFNPGLAKHFLRRFWPLPVAIALLVGLGTVPSIYGDFCNAVSGNLPGSVWYENGVEYIRDTGEMFVAVTRGAVYDQAVQCAIFQIITALIATLLVMHHIHGRKQIQFYHGLPLTRRCIYITSVVIGYVLALVPVLLVELVVMVMSVGYGVSLLPSVQVIGSTVVSFTLYYSLGILACVLGGQTLGAALLYGGLNCFVFALMAGGAGVIRTILPGFNEPILLNDLTLWLTPVAKMAEAAETIYDSQSIPVGLELRGHVVYGIVGVILLVLAGFLYRRRRGERAGEMIAFHPIRLVSHVIAAVILGLVGTMVMMELIYGEKDITFPVIAGLMVGITALGWFVAEMILQKTFRVFGKKSLGACAGMLVVLLAVLAWVRLDVTGYAVRVPAEETVTGTTVSMNGIVVNLEPEDCIRLHRTVLEHMDELSNGTSYMPTNQIDIRYQLVGSGEMSRTYEVAGLTAAESRILEQLLAVTSAPEYVYQSWFDGRSLKNGSPQVSGGYLRSYSYATEDDRWVMYLENDREPGSEELKLTGQEGELLYQAMVQDILAGNLSCRFANYLEERPVEIGAVEFYLRTDPNGQIVRDGWPTVYIPLNTAMKCTLEAMEELGVTRNPEAGAE